MQIKLDNLDIILVLIRKRIVDKSLTNLFRFVLKYAIIKIDC